MKQIRPLVSIVLPAYNAEKYLADTVRSVQNQTFTDWELLILDDASHDSTADVVLQFAKEDPRIRLFRNTENMGTAGTRNKGLQLAIGEYIAFLDSDDLWHPSKLEFQLAELQKTNADIVYASYGIIDETGKKICPDYIVPRTTDYSRLLQMNVLGCSTVMVRAGALAGFLFPAEYYHEDYALWLLLLRAGKRAVGLPQVLVSYRRRAGSRASNKAVGAWQRWKIYRSLLGLTLGQSVLCSMRYAWNGLRKYRRLPR